MPRTSSDELYRLIHALTAEEKGYFKKFARRHTAKGNNYLLLFDAINKQKEFEEKSLKKKFKDYAVMKVYLFDMILNCMMIYSKEGGLTAELHKQMLHVFFLQKKGLADKVIQLTERGLKKAEEAELFWLQDEFRRHHHVNTKLTIKTTERDEFNREFFESLRHIRQQLDERDALHELFQKLLSIDLQQTFNNKSLESFMRKLAIDALIAKNNTGSVSAERMRFSIISRYYHLKNDREGQYKTAREFYRLEKKLWDNNSSLKTYDSYIKCLRNLIQPCLYSQRFDEALRITEEMKSVRTGNEMLDVENDLCYFIYRQYIFWGSKKHLEGEAYTASNFPAKELNRHGEKFRSLLQVIHCNKILFEFSNGNHKEVFKSMATLESFDLKKQAPFYYKSCELMKLLLQVELGNYELLPSLTANTLQHLSAVGLTNLEMKLFMPFKKINAINKIEILKSLQQQLTKAKEEIRFFHMLKLNFWLQSQIERKSLPAVFFPD